MTEEIKLDLDAIEAAAKAATPQDFDSAEETSDGGYINCPTCDGEGSVELGRDHLNYDGEAIGVQFYGVGDAHVKAEAFLRAAKPAVVLELVRRLRSAESLVAARIVEVSTDSVAVALIGDLKPENIRELKAFHDVLRAQRNPGALVVCVAAPSDLVVLDADQMRKIGWVRAPEQVVPA